MKVLFAVSDEKDAQAITRVYQKEYKEIITSKTVYYFNAIIKELQKDKSYDRIVISEDVEMFASDNYQAVDKFIFDKMDAISDEATNEEGNDIPIILLGMDRRTKSDPLLVKLFGLGLYNVLVGQDRSLQKVAALMYKPRTKKEAKAYYKVETEKVNYTADNKNGGVNESEIQNILTHYKKIGNNIPKCVQSFDSIASQYSKDQVKLIAQVLPNNVKVILEENSDTYRKIMGIKGKKAAGTSELRKAEYVEKEIDSGNKLTQPVIIPTAINPTKPTVKKTTTVEKAEKIKESKRKEEERIARVKAAAEAKKKEAERIAKEKAEAEAKRKEEERIAKEKAEAEAKRKEEERIAKEKAEAEAKRKEAERIAKEKAEAEAKRKEAERIAKEKAEAEAKRKEAERIAKEKAAAEAKKKEEERIAKMKTDEENEVITTAKRGRGRPRKNPVEAVVLEDVPVKKKRGRPRKNPIVEEEKVEEKVVKPSKDDFEDDLLAQFDDYEDDVVEAAPKASEAEEVNKNDVDEFDYDSFDDMNEDEFDYDLVDDEEDEEEADDDFDYSSLDEDDEDIDFDSIEKEMDAKEELDSSDNNQVEDNDNYDDFEDYEEDDFDEYDDNDENEKSVEDDESYEDEEFEDEDSDDFDYDLVDDELDSAEDAEEDIEESDEDFDLGWDDEEDDTLPGFEDDEEETAENEDIDTVEESDEDFDDEFDDDDYDSLPGVNDEDEIDDSDAETELSNEELDSFEDEDVLPGFEDDEEETKSESIDEPEKVEEESAHEEVNEIQHNGAFKGINNRNYRYDNDLANSIKDLKETEETSSYNLETDNLITSNQKIVAFVGTTKNGTSFIVNNLAEVYSNRGIKTAILDLTKNKNSYYIYTNNEDTLREKAQNCLDKLVEGTADGVVVNKNLTVFTSLPGQDDALDDVTGIIKTLLENYTIVLLDCDFDTDVRYFRTAQEMYLVQSLDVLTIQPLTAFLRDLKVKEILETNKLRIVINKNIKVKSLTEKVLIGGMSVYNDPSMTYMTELFNKDTIKYTTVPFEDQVYVNYLEGLVNCEISLKGYSKNFISSMNRLADMAYPTIGGKNVTNNRQFEDAFSKDTSSILNKMKKKY